MTDYDSANWHRAHSDSALSDGADSEPYELVDGMVAAESPQRTAARIIELLKRGEVEQVRELMQRRAARVSQTMARELAAAEQG